MITAAERRKLNARRDDAVRALSPDQVERARHSWATIADAIVTRALARRPPAKSFEVHHEQETARAAMLDILAGGGTLGAAEAAAYAAVSLVPEALA